VESEPVQPPNRETRRGNRAVNFSRKPIFGAGAGHISPIGGYLEDENPVFVPDVNEDDRPWLSERSRLFNGLDTFAGVRKRGLLRIG
jgi:hypothetical protein